MSILLQTANLIAEKTGPWHGGNRGPTAGARTKAITIAYALADAGLLALTDEEATAVEASRQTSPPTSLS